MKKNKYFTLTIMTVVLFISGVSSLDSNHFLNQDEMEKYLKNAPILSIEKDLELGRTNFWRITLNDGKKERRAIFKHVDRPRPHILSDSYKYELAAYKLNKMLSLNIVPPLVERTINNQEGSLQLLVENVITERERALKKIKPKNPQEFKNDLDLINLFRILVHDQSSDTNDILIQLDNWKVWRVDFSMAFFPSSDILPESRIERCSKSLFKNLMDIKNRHLEKELDPYLNKREINGLIERKNTIIRTIRNLIKLNGEEAVLF